MSPRPPSLRLVHDSTAPPAEPSPFDGDGSGDGSETPAGKAPDLGALFDRYSAYVGAVALRLLGRPEDVDDVVQDVFLAAHKGLRHADDPRQVKRWLAKVTVRTARRRLRMMRAKGFLGMGDEPDYEYLADEGATPEQRTLLAAIYDVLERVPVNERLCWQLRFVEGHKLEDVAELSGCSLATAKRRIAATQTALREAFEP
ncbi:MAG: sigma-70 family RNA polymerase sigma factor [Myxococcota bacterium]